MSIGAVHPAGNDGLSHTTLRIGRGLSSASLAAVVHALQRVPGVLTVDADGEHAQAFVAHDDAVPIIALVAAANRAGAVARIDVAPTVTIGAAPEESGVSRIAQRRLLLGSIGLATVCLVLLVDFTLPDGPGRRWSFLAPMLIFWALIMFQSGRARRMR